MKYRLGWLPYERYSGVTVAADYRGSVTVKTTAVSDYCTKQTVADDYRGSVTSKNNAVSDYCTKQAVAADYRGEA